LNTTLESPEAASEAATVKVTSRVAAVVLLKTIEDGLAVIELMVGPLSSLSTAAFTELLVVLPLSSVTEAVIVTVFCTPLGKSPLLKVAVYTKLDPL
jgi:hypothetical protein